MIEQGCKSALIKTEMTLVLFWSYHQNKAGASSKNEDFDTFTTPVPIVSL